MPSSRIKLSDGSSWPRPALESDDEYGVGHRLRYLPQDKLTREDLLLAATICDSYGYMVVELTQRRRNAVCSEIQQQLRGDSDAQ
ncbi:hypothetical protein SEA_BUDSKI_81 [Gordonia phage Budski]|nr:hypothetical protein SEA_BUDSKI_81 [Gordonia phage Budski]